MKLIVCMCQNSQVKQERPASVYPITLDLDSWALLQQTALFLIESFASIFANGTSLVP